MAYPGSVIALLSGLLFGAMLAGAVMFAFGFYAGARWEIGRDEAPAPRLAIPRDTSPPPRRAVPTNGTVARYSLPEEEDLDRFCLRTDWCAGHLGHSGECFTSPLGERPR